MAALSCLLLLICILLIIGRSLLGDGPPAGFGNGNSGWDDGGAQANFNDPFSSSGFNNQRGQLSLYKCNHHVEQHIKYFSYCSIEKNNHISTYVMH